MDAPSLSLAPWDDERMTEDLLRLAHALPRQLLTQLAAPDLPGAYIQFLAARELESILGATLAFGRYPVYVGVASSLRERLRRYVQSLRGMPVRPSQIHVVLIPCRTKASACFAEAALIEQLNPIWNALGGWGQKVPGAKRVGQRCSPVDALLLGERRWASAPSIVDRARAYLRLVSHLAELDPTGHRWPPLL